jgi:hypothetical protein
MITNYISFRYFLISFAIGLFLVYIYGPETKTINIYPTPENVDKILYKDNADNCFAYNQIEVKCPKDENMITKVPLQID